MSGEPDSPRQPGAPFLVFGEGAQRLELPVLGSRIVLGRSSRCDIVVRDSRASKRHAALALLNGAWHVWDLDSRNGTFLNGERIHRQPLKPGDEVMIGATTLRFELEDERGLVGGVAPVQQDLCARLAALRERLDTIHPYSPVDQVVERILEAAMQAVAIDRAHLLLVKDGDLVCAGSLRRGWPRVSRGGGPSRSIIDQVLRDGAIFLTPDAAADARLSAASSVAEGGIRAAVAIPLTAGRRTIGILHVDRLKPRSFDEAEVAALVTVCDRGAPSVAGARMLVRLRALSEELSEARGALETTKERMREIEGELDALEHLDPRSPLEGLQHRLASSSSGSSSSSSSGEHEAATGETEV